MQWIDKTCVGRLNTVSSTPRFTSVTLLSSTGFISLHIVMLNLLIITLTGCGTQPIKPEAKNIKVTREEVNSDCKELGLVEGRSLSTSTTFEHVLEDMKLDAARKGANVVKLETTSGTGTAVRGTAYVCP